MSSRRSSPEIIPLADVPPAPEPAPPPEAPAPPAADAAPFVRHPANTTKLKSKIVEHISKVFDPEIPVNIHELGLIYEIGVDADFNVRILMTLTAPACPSAQAIPLDVEHRVREIPDVKNVTVEIVWDPPWTKDRMSDVAKLQLGML